MNAAAILDSHIHRSRRAGRASVAFLVFLAGCPSREHSADDRAGETESTDSGGVTEGVLPTSDASVQTAGTADGTDGGPTSASGWEAGTDDTTGQATEVDTEPSAAGCQMASCYGGVWECGDCVDNDGDGLIDAADPDCWGPCDNNEGGFDANLLSQGPAAGPCARVDCFFDRDSGSGNDDCHWSFRCDPLDPHPWCSHNPGHDIPGTDMTCGEALVTQSQQCLSVCGPLIPNGCDCFGCCEVTVGGETHTVYLGSEDADTSAGTCSAANVADPTKCRPCTQVPACLNPCEPHECEICIGDPTLPDGCDEAGCPAGVQPCLPELLSSDCPDGMACITGCCILVPDW